MNSPALESPPQSEEQLQQKKYDLYLRIINVKFNELSVEERKPFLGKLEKFVSDVLTPRKSEATYSLRDKHAEEAPDFDYEEAQKLRIQQNLTQAELAEKLGISSRALSFYENGKSNPYATGKPTATAYLKWLEESCFSKKDEQP